MKTLVSFTLLLTLLPLTYSCESEYHERLREARKLKKKMEMVTESNDLLPREHLRSEIRSIREEIHFLAKVSGNEELFLKEVYTD